MSVRKIDHVVWYKRNVLFCFFGEKEQIKNQGINFLRASLPVAVEPGHHQPKRKRGQPPPEQHTRSTGSIERWNELDVRIC